MGDPAFNARVQAKTSKILASIQKSEGKEPTGEVDDSFNLANIVAVLTGKLAVAEVHLDELHDRILDLEGRSAEKPDRTGS